MNNKTGAVANYQPKQEIAKSGGFDLAKMFNFTRDKIELIKQTVAKNTTDTELAYFLQVAKEVNLSPFTKEIWCYKDNRGNVLIFAGRDGFRSIAQRNEKFIDMNSVEVCAKDIFKMGIKNGKPYIDHEFSGNHTGRGDIIGAYCVINMTGGGQVIEWADIKDYDKGQFTWASHKSEMIKKVAEIHAVKKMGNIRGIYAEEEFTIKGGVVVNTDPAPAKTNASELIAPIEEPENITGEQMITIQDELARVGKNLAGLLEYLKHNKIEEITYKEANTWITALSTQPSVDKAGDKIIAETIKAGTKVIYAKQPQAIEGEVIEEMPPIVESPGKALLRRTAQNLKNKKATTVAPPALVPLPGDVCLVVNALDAKYKADPASLSMDELQLLDDCDKGKFKGKEAYLTNWK